MKLLNKILLPAIILFIASCGTEPETQDYNVRVTLDADSTYQVATVRNRHLHTDFVQAPATIDVAVSNGDEIGVTLLFPNEQEITPEVLANNTSRLTPDRVAYEYPAVGIEGYTAKRYIYIAPTL